VSTLGLVELFIWLLLSYWDDINIAKEKVFAKVHFTLFYTAIFNAFQTVIVAFFTTRISQRMWVQTETLELNHYVEIREEFDRVRTKLNGLRNLKGRNEERNNNEDKSSNLPKLTTGEFVFELSRRSFHDLWLSIVDRVRYPHLKARYNQLLVQVRFHELRVHFLQSYNLPLKFKVSDYLVRSEKHVLIKLVHVSTVAWLLLTASINLLYFIMGIITWKTEQPSLIGTSFIWLFFLSMGLFIVISFALYNKMKAIFKTIMFEKTLWDVRDSNEIEEELAEHQRRLFWGGDPAFVIASIQFMQFGYAVALAVVLIFWETINDGGLNMGSYLISIFACYSIFVAVAAEILPRYTLCTSLGQLVDRRRLDEAIALYHLEEEKQKQLREAFEIDLLFKTDSTVLEDSSTLSHVYPNNQIKSGPIIANLVKIDTESLREKLPETEREQLSRREQQRKNRRLNRRKAVSDGVAAMAGMKRPSKRSMDDLEIPSARKSQGFLFRESTSTVSGESSKKDGKSLTNDTRVERAAQRRRMRHQRRKSVSDGVAAMAWNASTIDEDEATPDEGNTRIPFLVFDDNDAASTSSALSGAAPDIPLNSLPPIHEKSSDIDARIDNSFRTEKDVQSVSAVSVASNQGQTYDIDSTASEDGHSDVDDVPKIDPLVLKRVAAGLRQKPLPTFHERIREYFLSKRYKVISNVFGTMIAFFFVGERVERFLHTDNVVSDDFVSFDFDNAISFWALTFWFIMFQLKNVLVFFTFRPRKGLTTNKERMLITAALIDCVLTSVCLVVLFVAEAQRCCHPIVSPTRMLAEKDTTFDSDYDSQIPAPCSCPKFGSRVYGGLGTIEPYISLVALRLFRFWISNRVVSYLDSRNFFPVKDKAKDSIHHAQIIDPFDVFDEVHRHATSSDELVGTAVELWEAAIGKYPKIASEYGQFSGELLKLMLGIQILRGNDVAIAGDEKAEVNGIPKDAIKAKKRPPTGRVDDLNSSRKYMVADEYSKLSAQAQGILVAGKLGKNVKFSKDLQKALVNGVSHIKSFPEEKVTPHGSHGIPDHSRLTFQVDDQSMDSREYDGPFVSPNARLVRSMRRADRKLLPILDKWMVVDVIMTRFEMIYLDAVDVDGHHLDEKVDGARQAIVATKGGKGLRLCDITTGRRVVGHLQFTDITSIHVERRMPSEATDDTHDNEQQVAKMEYWQQHHGEINTQGVSRAWHKIKQDILTIETSHGPTLRLRFYSDLDDCLCHMSRMMMESEAEGPIFKNNAFQWVQTIGRYCGPEQLTQSLQHFGEDSADELRDYLLVHDSEEKGKGHRRVKSKGFPISAVPRPRSTQRSASATLLTRPTLLHRSSSVGEASSGEAMPKMRLLYRRSASIGENAIGTTTNTDSSPPGDEAKLLNNCSELDDFDVV
jgi:hypothetical protein